MVAVGEGSKQQGSTGSKVNADTRKKETPFHLTESLAVFEQPYAIGLEPTKGSDLITTLHSLPKGNHAIINHPPPKKNHG